MAGEVCGALSGGALAIGLLYGQDQDEAVLHLTEQFMHQFAEHKRIVQELGIALFFTHLYAAWERGANENMNGLVTQYIPKNRELISVTEDELEQIMIKLNHHPRKCLDFKSPFEVFFEQFIALTI
jgi:IS30 family transposase